MSSISFIIYIDSDKGIFYGEKGYMIVQNINNPQWIDVFDCEDRLIRHVDVPKQISGYEYEVMESLDMIRQGQFQSKSMPLSESIYMMKLMDDNEVQPVNSHV